MFECIYQNGKVIFNVDFYTKERAKDLGAFWDKENQVWYKDLNNLYLEYGNTQSIIRFLNSGGFDFSDSSKISLEQAINEKEQQAKDLEDKKRNYLAPQPSDMAVELYPFQKAGVAFLEDLKTAILGDEMGLGKTVQSIGWARNKFPVLVICPSSVKENWSREILKFLPKSMVGVVDGQVITYYANNHKPLIQKANDLMSCPEWLVINYDMIGEWLAWLVDQSFNSVIVDEAHYIKNSKANRTINCLLLSECIENRLCVTGTPLLNRPIELFTLLQFIGKVKKKDLYWWRKRYCELEEKEVDVSVNEGKLKSKKISSPRNYRELRAEILPYYIRRLKSEVLIDLPEKTFQNYFVELSNRNEYDDAEEDIVKYIALTDGLEKADAARRAKFLAKLNKLRQLSVDGKLNSVKKLILDFKEQSEDKKIVIFSNFVNVLKKLKRDLGKEAVIYTGDDAEQSSIDSFQSNPNIRFFLTTIKKGGVGITLTKSDTVVFIDLPWTPGEKSQAEDRCLVGDSLILTGDKKLIKIKFLKVGDTVVTHNGNIKKIINFKKRNYRGLFTKINYKGWYDPLECTYDHRILVKKRDGDIKWLEAHKILPGDSICFPKIKDWKSLEIIETSKWKLYKEYDDICFIKDCFEKKEARKMCRKHYRYFLRKTNGNRPAPEIYINGRYKKLPSFINVTDDWLYLFGWYAAEGFASLKKGKGKFVSLSGHEDEEFILKKIGKLFSSIEVNWRIYKNKKTKGIELRAYSEELARWFSDWFGSKCENKKLPQEILQLPPHQAHIVLKGYTDGDGYQRNKQVEWVSVSQTLSYQMCILAVRSGFIPTFRKIISHKNDHWIGSFTKFGQPSNKKLSDQNDDFIFRPVSKIETFYDRKDVYDLTVEDDHSFICGFASVHNCHRIGQKDNVTVCHVIGNDTIDNMILNTLETKKRIISKIVDGKYTDDEKEFNTFEMLEKMMKNKHNIQ